MARCMQSALTCAQRLAAGLDNLLRAMEVTEIVCVQNSYSLADRTSFPVLHECARRDIVFVPFCPLGCRLSHQLRQDALNGR